MLQQNLLIIQGGGPSPVFNLTFASAVREAQSHIEIDHIFGALSGMAGLALGNVLDLSELQTAELDTIARSPGAILGSSREEPTENDLRAAIKCLRENNIHFVLFMGGNGTMKGAAAFARFCQSENFDVQIIGVPKTIDNDIASTDRCPGFASAARYVAQSVLDLSADLRSLPKSVSIVETLGRDSGWLAASSNLASQQLGDAPHLVCVPEIPFVMDPFLDAVDSAFTRFGWVMVVAGEGIQYADGTPVFAQQMLGTGEQKARPIIGGVAEYLAGLVSKRLKIRCRSEKPGLIGRSCMAQVAAQDMVDAELVGRTGIRALVTGLSSQMVALMPIDHISSSGTVMVAFSTVENRQRPIPREWLTEDGLATGEYFRSFTKPLVGALSAPMRPLPWKP